MTRHSVVFAAIVAVLSAGPAGAIPPTPLQVTVNPDGSFTPEVLRIHDGDVVEWILHDRADAIVQGLPPTSIVPWNDCLPAKPWDPADVNNLAGPMPEGASGIFTTGRFGDDRGFEVTTGPCSDGRDPAASAPPNGAGTEERLCATGPPGVNMLDTWESPDITGVHIRLLWRQIQPRPDRFFFDDLARELDNAVRHGKLFSLSVKAGDSGTPDWIFSTPAVERNNPRPLPRVSHRGSVTRLKFRDAGDDADGCGAEMYLGNPTEQAYRDLWGAMLTELASFVKSRADWYRALAYVRLSGANLFSAENRLPNQCKPDCDICNTEVWAKAGYTPDGLYAFYQWQEDLLEGLFPDKTISYQLIQAGFPRVNNDGCWMVGEGDEADTICPVPQPPSFPPLYVRIEGTDLLPGGTQQTTQIINRGIDNLGALFHVQHNGIGVEPESPADVCPNYLLHHWTLPPAGPEFANAGTGCPNHWVLEAEMVGQISGFQTKNDHGVATPAELDSTILNAWHSSDSAYLEIYEQRRWEARRYEQSGIVQASGHTIGRWNEKLHDRRRNRLVSVTGLPDPFPATFTYQFHRSSGAAGDETVHYFNAGKCGPGNPKTGTVVIEPSLF